MAWKITKMLGVLIEIAIENTGTIEWEIEHRIIVAVAVAELTSSTITGVITISTKMLAPQSTKTRMVTRVVYILKAKEIVTLIIQKTVTTSKVVIRIV